MRLPGTLLTVAERTDWLATLVIVAGYCLRSNRYDTRLVAILLVAEYVTAVPIAAIT